MVAEIPSIWREELWHPFSVHIPIATLLLSSVAAIVLTAVKNKIYKPFIKQLILVLLAIGVISGWIAIYTGELAYTIEVRKICDPQVLQDHQWWAYATLIIYSVALSLKILTKFIAVKFSKAAKLLFLLLSITALFGLLYTGHLGASLVYQQGAGTYTPSADCSEFVK